jgi:hypothetical protein
MSLTYFGWLAFLRFLLLLPALLMQMKQMNSKQLFNAFLTLVLIFVAGTAMGQSQTGTIRGFVYLKSSGEAEPYVNVYLNEGGTYGASTDVNGFFTISKVPIGKHTLHVKSIGYDEISLSVEITKKGHILNKKLFLKGSSVQLNTFTVDAERTEAQTTVKVSVITATPTIIGYVPTVGGDADIATYMQTLPGVVFTGDQGGQLYIRGGSPIQNKVLLDGMIIYNPFHSIGFFSVFDTDIIRSADIYTGGFNAEYGGRISSIMDITTRDGNKKKIAGKVSVSPFMAKGLLEGPLKKQDEAGGGSSSFLFSGKTSYLEQTSKVLYAPIEGVDSAGLPFNFTDLYGKISFNGSNGSKVNFFGFSFNDQVKYQAVQDFHWNSYGMGSNFVLVPAGSPVLIEGNFAYSNYAISLEEIVPVGEDPQPRSSDISGFNFGLDFKYFLNENEVKYGLEVIGYQTNFNFFNAVGRTIEQNENTTELAGYLDYKFTKGLFIFEPSFRAHYYASLSTFSPEPRLGMKVNATEKLRFKMAAGVYSQNLMSANSDRDVVNLFYGFLAGPDNLQDEATDEEGNERDITHSLQRANHLIVGTEYDITDHINLNVEAYVKDFRQLTNMNRNKVFDDSPDNFFRPDVLKKDFIIETGMARGVDFVIKYQNKRKYFWAVYSIGKVDRWDGFQTYSPVFDRRHNVNFVASYRFGQGKEYTDENGEKQRKQEVYEFTARWNLGTGLPFTQTQGYYELQDFGDGINTDVATTNGELGIIYADINEGRLPTYHRMDFNIKRSWEFKNDTKLEANLGVTNAYNRQNIFYVDRITNERVDQLPFLPSLGINWAF